MITTLARRARRRMHALGREDDGFTLLEATVSLTLLAVVASASVIAVTNSTQSEASAHNRAAAAALAAQDIQAARTLRYPDRPQAEAAHTVTVGNLKYTVSRTVQVLDTSNNLTSGTCSTDGTYTYTSLRVTSTVAWSADSVSLGTVIAC